MIRRDPELIAAIGPRVRKSPYFDRTVAAGLVAVSSYNHMWLPMSYGDPEAEYERLVSGVSMWDVAAQRHIEVAGSGADRFVDHVTAVPTSDVEPRTATYAPMVDFQGQLINDPILVNRGDGSWRFSIADGDIGLWLRALAHGDDVDVTVRELDTATLAVQGPRAGEVAAALGLDEFGDLDEMEHVATEVDGDIHVLLSRSGWSAQGGFELFLDDASRAVDLWDAVAEAGRPLDIGPGAPNATERIENVLLSYGTDTGYDADPFELGLDDLIDLDGDPFVGRDALREVAQRGPARRLIGCVIDGDPIDVLSHPVPVVPTGSDVDDPVGQLRSATDSRRFGRNIGLCLVRSGLEPGDTLAAVLPEGVRSIELVDLPFELDSQ